MSRASCTTEKYKITRPPGGSIHPENLVRMPCIVFTPDSSKLDRQTDRGTAENVNLSPPPSINLRKTKNLYMLKHINFPLSSYDFGSNKGGTTARSASSTLPQSHGVLVLTILVLFGSRDVHLASSVLGAVSHVDLIIGVCETVVGDAVLPVGGGGEGAFINRHEDGMTDSLARPALYVQEPDVMRNTRENGKQYVRLDTTMHDICECNISIQQSENVCCTYSPSPSM